MNRYQLIIFDLDGTLLDTLEDLMNATNHVLSQMGHPTRTLEEVRRFVGNGIRNLMLELLATLRQKGYRIAILSNKADTAVRSLCEQYFPHLYDLCRGERSGVAKKPAPDAVYGILSEMQIPKEAAVFIGDSEVDVLTAKNAGMDLICVDWGFRSAQTLRHAGAELIVSDTDALRELL